MDFQFQLPVGVRLVFTCEGIVLSVPKESERATLEYLEKFAQDWRRRVGGTVARVSKVGENRGSTKSISPVSDSSKIHVHPVTPSPSTVPGATPIVSGTLMPAPWDPRQQIPAESFTAHGGSRSHFPWCPPDHEGSCNPDGGSFKAGKPVVPPITAPVAIPQANPFDAYPQCYVCGALIDTNFPHMTHAEKGKRHSQCADNTPPETPASESKPDGSDATPATSGEQSSGISKKEETTK